MKIKKGDLVQVIRGKEKGKTEKVEKVLAKSEMVFVTAVNLFKRHLRRQGQSQPSDIVSIQKPLSVASVRLICPTCKVMTRVGYGLEDGKKVRVCRKCDKTI